MARTYPVVPIPPFAGSATAAPGGIAVPGSKQGGTPAYSVAPATLIAGSAWPSGLSGMTTNTPGAGRVPPLEEMNAIQFISTYGLASILECGIPDYNAGITYSLNSFCQYNGLIYQSLVNSNIGNTPSSSPTKWIVYIAGNPVFWGGTAGGNVQAMTITVSNLPGTVSPGTTFILKTPAIGAGSQSALTLSVNSGAISGNIIDVYGNEIFSNTAFVNGYVGESETISVVWNGTNFILISSTTSRFAGSLSISTGLGSSQNNYNPGTGWVPTVGQLILAPSASINITGLIPLQAGTEVILQNQSSNTLTLTNQDSSSSAANRFATYNGSNFAIPENGFCRLTYLGGRWLVEP